jgi:hypothetical protein
VTVQRYRRKPRQEDREDQFAARYEPGQPLDDLRAVARMAGDEAEVIEAVFPSGKRLLLAWFLRYDDHHPAKPDYATVEAGNYLAFSSGGESLYETDDGDLRQFYDLAPDGERTAGTDYAALTGKFWLVIARSDGTEDRGYPAIKADGSWTYHVPAGVSLAGGSPVNPGDTVSGQIDLSDW